MELLKILWDSIGISLNETKNKEKQLGVACRPGLDVEGKKSTSRWWGS